MTDLFSHPSFAGQITHVQTLPARSAKLTKPEAPMHPRLRETVARFGAEDLFTHQAAAYDAFFAGNDLAVVTGTNSGKTLCYNLPTLQTCLTEPVCRALYVFPTKALAQDQYGKLEALIPGPDIRAGVYDGDTSPGKRAAVRKVANIVLTNPDMLHTGILPGHENWSKFLKSLRVVVLDEMHVYRGVFGSHVGCIMRRLLRLCEWHRSHPRIIACSATIGNPKELFEKLTGRTCQLIAEDGSPKARRTFVFWNPPRLPSIEGSERGRKPEAENGSKPEAQGERVSANVVSAQILATLCENHLRTLAFCRARVTAELVLRYTRSIIQRDRESERNGVSPEMVESYRAGYTAKERRQIERALFKGDLLGLAATNAMELGVDIGGLDAVVMNGYPGTISSFWQQSGRAGRGTREGLAIMVAQDDPLDQFLVREPHRIMEADNDFVALNPFNAQVLAQQLKCAAFERPIAPSELEIWDQPARAGSRNVAPQPSLSDSVLRVLEALDRSGELQFQNGRFWYPAREPPAAKVNIRGSGSEQVTLLHHGEELGSMELWRAMQAAHEGAIYLHRGASYVVEELDLQGGKAHVSARQVPYFTQAVVQSVIESQVDIQLKQWGRHDARLEGLKVTDVVAGFKQISLENHAVLTIQPLEMPPQSYETLGVRLDLPFEIIGEEDVAGAAIGALHGLEHALMAVAPLIAGCDRGDLGSAWYSAFQNTLRPALFVFDRTPGGVGLSESLFRNLRGWANSALQLLCGCDCADGCPACLLSSRCEANNDMLDKQGAVRLLRELLHASR